MIRNESMPKATGNRRGAKAKNVAPATVRRQGRSPFPTEGRDGLLDESINSRVRDLVCPRANVQEGLMATASSTFGCHHRDRNRSLLTRNQRKAGGTDKVEYG